MIKRVLIIGGYGNFGSVIAKALAKEPFIQIIVSGRSLKKAQAFIDQLDSKNKPEAACIDINKDFALDLQIIKPDIVIHTSGPFQEQGYDVAKACINASIHYIDLADGRSFVEGIETLNSLAKQKNVLVISGASSVPCLTSALLDHYKDQFQSFHTLDYAITTAQKTSRGLATTAAILGYTGKPFETIIDGIKTTIYGLQGLILRKYTSIGWRLLGNCDVPDLSLFPKRYPTLKTIRFYAGLEVPFIHLTLWGFSWLVRLGIIDNLRRYAPLLLHISFIFDFLGSSNSGFHLTLSGKDIKGLNKQITFELIAKSGDGPNIPCIPAIIIAKRLVNQQIKHTGSFPCLGFITLQEYLDYLKNLDVTYHEL